MKATYLLAAVIALSGCRPHPPRRVVELPPAPTGTTVAEPARVQPGVPVTEPVREPVRVDAKVEPAAEPRRDLAGILAGLAGSLVDVLFEYDRFDLTNDALDAAQRNARLLAPILADFPLVKVIVEGHCDERGSAEYNIALGDRRAVQTADTLRKLGIPDGRLETISYGKEMPQCTEEVESCWRRNRRAHLTVREQGGQAPE